jgi:hypothetical protein
MRHLRAEDLAEGLMAQADAEDGQIGGLGPGQQGRADAGLGGDTGPRGQEDSVVGAHGLGHIGCRDVVVADHVDLRSELAQIGHERVDEAVVVVDDEDLGHWPPSVTVALLKGI